MFSTDPIAGGQASLSQRGLAAVFGLDLDAQIARFTLAARTGFAIDLFVHRERRMANDTARRVERAKGLRVMLGGAMLGGAMFRVKLMIHVGRCILCTLKFGLTIEVWFLHLS
ncbi:hypothetical protein [Stieleria tagensis]|uniref:hypothetical protein n=1 Tax=Stieleria tagensis TaxID=2956795 RepID=UPI00209BA8B4|nr:hypothetical protein [Stieleria tagensis]